MTDESRNNPSTCPDCGTKIPEGTPETMCPECRFRAGHGDSLLADTVASTGENHSPDWVPPTVEELHALLPQYEISAVLGRGGMGAVYKGCQTNLKRNVAIKVLPENLGRGGGGGEDSDAHQFVERFKLEAQSMANLDHPAILSVYDFGETSDGQLYIVMEFIDGMDIHAYLQYHGGKLRHEHAIAITANVLDALECAHDHGVVHRDIKPANVLISSEGRVKIADFGLAKRFTEAGDDEGESPTGLTSANVVMGTPDFVAPEALEIGTNPDGRADLYAVGVMFYQMLTGKLPRGQFEPPSVLDPVLDPRFDAVVSKALEANPDRRYASARDFRRELDQLLNEPVSLAADLRSGKAPAAGAAGKRILVPSRLPYPRPKLAAPKNSKTPLVVGLALATMVVIGLWIHSTTRSGSGSGNIDQQTVPPSNPKTEPATVPPPAPEPLVVTETNSIPAPLPDPLPDPLPAPVVIPPQPEPEPEAEQYAGLAAIPGLELRLETYLKLRREQVGDLAGKYLKQLEIRLSEAARAGDLNLARAWEEEKTRVTGLQLALSEPPTDHFAAVAQPVTLPALPAAAPEAVSALRFTWATARQKIGDDLDGKLNLSLQALVAELTKGHEFDSAEAIAAYRDSLALPRHGGLGSGEIGKSVSFLKYAPLPKFEKGEWVTLFDGETLYGIDTKWERFDAEKASLEDGALRLDDTRVQFDLSGRDVALRATVRKISGQNLTLRCRQDDDGSCYAMWFNGGNAFGIGKKKAEKWSPLREASSAKPFSDFFVYQFEIIGDEITIVADREELGKIKDDQIRGSGKFAVVSMGVSLFKKIEAKVIK